MGDPDEVGELRFRHSFNASHLRRLQCAPDEDAEFKGASFWAYKEVAGLSRKHDRLMGGIDSLISKRGSGLAQAVPGIAQIPREVSRRYRLCSRPAVVRFALRDPLLAVVAFPAVHKTNCDARRRIAPPCVMTGRGEAENAASEPRSFSAGPICYSPAIRQLASL